MRRITKSVDILVAELCIHENYHSVAGEVSFFIYNLALDELVSRNVTLPFYVTKHLSRNNLALCC